MITKGKYKIRTLGHSLEIQKLLFLEGCVWTGSGKSTILKNSHIFLYVRDGKISWGSNEKDYLEYNYDKIVLKFGKLTIKEKNWYMNYEIY